MLVEEKLLEPFLERAHTLDVDERAIGVDKRKILLQLAFLMDSPASTIGPGLCRCCSRVLWGWSVCQGTPGGALRPRGASGVWPIGHSRCRRLLHPSSFDKIVNLFADVEPAQNVGKSIANRPGTGAHAQHPLRVGLPRSFLLGQSRMIGHRDRET